jgi:hypothetical protein
MMPVQVCKYRRGTAIFCRIQARDPPVVLKLEIGARVCNVLRSKSANMRY